MSSFVRSLTRPGNRSRSARAAGSRAVETGARCGFVARGVIYALVGVLALRIAFADDGGDRQADRGGALAEVAGQPFGNVLLWLIGIALAGMALWRLSEALFGQAGEDGTEPGKRALSAARCVFYGVVSFSVLAYAAGSGDSGSGSSDQQSDDVTATVMGWPAGQWIVVAAGAALAGAGVWIMVQAARRSFRKHLKSGRMTPGTRRAVDVLGVVGGIARGGAFAAAGGFAVAAGVRHEPGRARGMDDTLRSFAETPAGPWLLGVMAVGLVAFGAFSWASARWREI
ncbi:DUF1206 domain-containing protein [Streptomyces sp. NPDC006512]|uniref:DUF1206 domain-containing protein n=1 Tax=Streptomyces sp. NPDC006512 TaxID=3154307 RepID=UPI0033A508F6